MSRSIALASLLLGLQGTSAIAMDLTIKSTQSETVEISDNYFLAPAPKVIYRPLSTITVDAVGRTPTATFTLNGDFGYFKYLGPGAENMMTTDGKQYGVRFTAVKAGRTSDDKSFVTTSFRSQDSVSAQLADTGVASGSGEVTTFSAGGGLSRKVGLRDVLSWNVTGTSVEFTSPGSSPYVSLNNIATWKHRVNATNDIISFADFTWTWMDDQAQSETKFLRLMTGVRSNLTKRLDVTANVGVGFIEGSKGNPGAVVVTPTPGVLVPTFGGTGSAYGLLWDVLAVYRLQSTTRISVSAAQTVSPDVNGNYSKRNTAGATLARDINSRSSLLFSGQFTHYSAPGSQNGSSGAYDYYTATVSYDYRLAKEWRSSLAYAYRERNSELSAVSSNSVILTVAHDATVLP